MLTATVKNGQITIVLPYDKNGKPSKSGKSKIHATTSGNQTIVVDGKPLTIGVNAYCKG